ncbi:MAG: DUF1588 domain-containing protein [Deltaproteobacteria bacterium]|nr:DUF1588 domain-containing protein [Deltaproteobacteria bacterium]
MAAACSGRVADDDEPSGGGGGKPPPGDVQDVTDVLNGLPPGSMSSGAGSPSGRPRPSGVPVAGSDTCRAPKERVWQLSPLQMANTMATLVPGVDATLLKERLLRYASVGSPYTSDPGILNASSLFATDLNQTVTQLVDTLVSSGGGEHACVAKSPTRDCAQTVIKSLLPRAFRSPPANGVADDFLAFYDDASGKYGEGPAIKLLIERILSAPEVLFRRELGELDKKTGLLRLSAHERADLIAYAITDAPPDSQLRAAADDGSLLEPEVARREVDRLLGAAPPLEDIVEGMAEVRRKVAGPMRFLREFLSVEKTRFVTVKGSDERLLRWFDNEAMTFARHVLWEDDATLSKLLTADYTFYSNTLADHYGVARKDNYTAPAPTVNGRKGVLMQSSFLTGHDSATDRGKFIRARLFCQEIAAPDNNVDMNLEGLEEELEGEEKRNLSPREVRARHLKDPSCAACHQQLDPLGFPFDGFDVLGKPRTTWDGFPIDTGGEILGTSKSDGKVQNAPELVTKLAASSDVATCFVVQMYMYVHGRIPGEEDTCYLERLSTAFARSGGNVRELMAEMLTGDEMQTRMPDWKTESQGAKP